MIDYESIIIAVIGPKTKTEFENFIEKTKDPEKVYDEFIANRHIPYMDIIKLINESKNLPKDFKTKFIEYHKNFKQKSEEVSGNIVAKVDKFTIINKYKGLSKEETFKSFKAVIELFKKVVDKLKSKSFDAIIYGDIYLSNPKHSRAIAEYDHIKDIIRIKLYRDYSEHAYASLIHELAHRIWYKLLESSDKKDWYEEFDAKKDSKYKGKFPGFPTDASEKNTEEYFAYVIEEYIVDNKKYSELVDLIV
jgi:hypothetical protein